MNLLLRLVVVVGSSLAVLLSEPSPWVLAAAVGCAAGWAVWPASGFGLGAVTLATLGWALTDDRSLVVVSAALALLAAHLAAAVLATGPRDWWPDLGLVRVWSLRGAAMWLAAPLLYLVVVGFDDVDQRDLWPLGLAVAVVLVALGRATLDRPRTGATEPSG